MHTNTLETESQNTSYVLITDKFSDIIMDAKVDFQKKLRICKA